MRTLPCSGILYENTALRFCNRRNVCLNNSAVVCLANDTGTLPENESFRLRINSMIDIIFKEKAIISREEGDVSEKYKCSMRKICIGLISSTLLVEFL